MCQCGGGKEKRNLGAITLICGSIKLQTRTNEAWLKHDSLEEYLNAETDFFPLNARQQQNRV